ncbi:MAG TPA: IS256 family transposase [Candidatus Competibacteraceae bacterium]|nr:IS256 family transposase [Candidatus Competibacteraceae bacterium]
MPLGEVERVNEPSLEALATALAKPIKSEQDIAALSRQLLKLTVETALKAELDEHLGYERYAPAGRGSGNNRNGASRKTLKGEIGAVTIQTPRDRNGTFEPQLISKGQTRLTRFDGQLLALYAKGMTTRDIADTFEKMYGAEISPGLVANVTKAVWDSVQTWQSRPLETVYPILYLDGIVVKVRQDNRVINKTIHVALGVNRAGQKDVLGLWLAETEGAKFWLSILTELQNRGVKDIFIACVDGLTGFPEAIQTVYPKTQVQLCMVHLIRNTLQYVSYKDRRAVVTDLKGIYQAVTVVEAERALEALAERWDRNYPSLSQRWLRHWEHLIPIFDYPEDRRRVIDTTNAIESLNSVIRKAIHNRRLFPSDRSALKVVYLAIEQAAKKWTMPVKDWQRALNRFAILFEGRLPLT